jgi:hypothetical protein
MFRRKALRLGAVAAVVAAIAWIGVGRAEPEPHGALGWTPPTGIPRPDFGIVEAAPVPPAS